LAFGETAIKTVRGVLKSQLQAAANLGADEVVATDDEDAMAKLPPLDAVADAFSGKTAEKLIAKVKPGGVFATVLGPPANAGEYPKVKVVAVVAQPDAKTLLVMAEAVKSGKLTIPIGQKIPLKDAAQGHTAIAKGTAHGKVLLVVGGETGATKAEEAIKRVLSGYEAALNASDVDAVIPLYAEDGIFMPPYSPSAIGKASVRNAYQAVFQAITLSVKFHLEELVVMSPNWAFARTHSAGHTTDHATEAQSAEANQELFLFQRGADDAWTIARYSFSSTNPPPRRYERRARRSVGGPPKRIEVR
jgi:uncharacterized protein (TIGR02246 family)